MNTVNFFSSPIGLGHVTRDIAIADNFKDMRTNFVTGDGAARILKNLNFKVRDAYNPPSFVIKNGTLKSPARWLWNYYRYYNNCKKISREILQTDNPDLVVSDEDFASLTISQEMKIPTVLITDVLETRFTKGFASFVEKRMNRSMQEIIRKCDTVILPENGDDQDNIRRVGPIVRQTGFSRKELRTKFSFEKKTILISIGGTNAGLFLIREALESISKIDQDIETVLVAGPAINKRFENVRNLGFVDNLYELIFAADLLISLAGRSTIDEANAYGTPAIFIPIKGHFEQEDNARKEGFVFDDIKRLDGLILEKLDEEKRPTATDGARKASDIIKKMIN